MKIKNLLGLGLTMFCTTMMAQTNVFKETFDAAQTKATTDVGYYEYINLEDGDTWSVKDGTQSISNDASTVDANNWWRRAIKFRNLPLKEKTSYRLSWTLRGSKSYVGDDGAEANCSMKVGLMQGVENNDIAIGSDDNYATYSNFNEDNAKKYSKVVYFASKAAQDFRFDSLKATTEYYAPENKDKYFATFNIYNPGTFLLDNVSLDESWVESVDYNGAVIRVNFGYQTTAAALAKAEATKKLLLDNSCVKVTVDGAEQAILTVELREDGYLYIFLLEDLAGAPVVTFTNPENSGLVYSGSLADEGAVKDFTETATFDEELYAESSAFAAPMMISSVPVDGSFALPQNVSEFTFTFDRNVMTQDNDVAKAPTATLSNGEKLTLTTTDEFSTTLTFTRPATDLTKGTYTVSIANIVSEMGTQANDTTMSFEVGKIHLAKTVYTQENSTTFPDAEVNGIPEGWDVYSDGEERTFGNTYGSGGRVFATAAPQAKGIYTRASSGDASVTSPKVNIPAGNIEIRSYLAYWSNSSDIQVDVYNSNNEVVATKTFTPSVAGEANRNNNGFEFETSTIQFTNDAIGEFYVKYTLLTTGYNGMFVGGFDTYSYTITEGDVVDAVTVFADKTYGGANKVNAEDNCAPKEGSGWELYQDGAKRTAGTNYNYNGTRLFSLGVSNLAWGYYTNGSWSNGTSHYIIYGAEENGPKLTLPAGQVQITYYANNWKTDDRTLYFQILDADDNVAYDRHDVIHVGNSLGMNGNRSASVASQKVQFTWNVPEAGDYKIKLGGDGEMFVGNYTIEQMPSQAAYYYKLMAAAVAEAQAELDKCADSQYDGTTKTALQADVEKYSGESDMTTAAEYNAAIAEVEAHTKAMSTRRVNIADYNTAMTNIGDAISACTGTKYEALDAYKAANEVYAQYSAVSPSTLEDAELATTTANLQNYYSWLNNMSTKCVALLTKQTDDLAASLVAMDASMKSDASVVKAESSIKDDQELAYILKLKNLKALYDKLAAPESDTLFIKVDTEAMLEEVDSIDLSAFIQNRNIYTTETSNTKNLTDTKNVPGWNINIKNGSIGVEWSWVTTWAASEYNPVNDAFLLNGWNGDFTMEQNVSLLPVGTYRYVSGTQDRGFADTSDSKNAALETLAHWTVTGTDGTNDITGEEFSYIYWQTGEKRDSVAFDITNQGQWYALTNDNSSLIDVDAAGENPYGELLIGTRPISYQSSASVDNFQLYLTGKKEGFDYAAAAKKVQALIDGLGVKGDVNGDGQVNIADVNAVISVMCGDDTFKASADVNGDGNINIADVNAVITIMCGGTVE